MRTTTVFATATSTIHADLTIVGLKRVGISTGCISVLYPSCSQPDTVPYWIDGSSNLPLSRAGETATVSGLLRFALEDRSNGNEIPSLVGQLRSLGLTAEQSQSFETALLEDRVVICVEAADDSEVALIFHLFHHIGAENMMIAETELGKFHRRGIHARAESELSVKAGLSLSAA